MVHIVGLHCAKANPKICPLCEIRLTPLDSESVKVEHCIQLLVLDRHLREAHLPEIELMGRLFHSFGDTIATKTLLKASPSMETLMRSFRYGPTQ